MYSYLKPLLFLLDPETAHDSVKMVSRFFPPALLKSVACYKSTRLNAKIGKVSLENPIGLAAGFDKNAEMIPFMSALGFGFLEIGSITAYPSPGNPKPRLFRLPQDQSIINRLGLPNKGVTHVAKQLNSFRSPSPLGINLAQTPQLAFEDGKRPGTGIDDYLETFAKLHTKGAYVVFNLSCPNTEEGTTFEHPSQFEPLAKAIAGTRKSLGVTKPLLIKLSPDMEKKHLSKTVDMALKYGFDGFVVSNTTPSRPKLKTSSREIQKIGKGGLSGQALTSLANAQLKNVYDIVGQDKILMGVGGLMSFEDLLAKMAAGASFFQIYTGLIYGGPFFVKMLLVKLDQLCQKLKVRSYQELVGVVDL